MSPRQGQNDEHRLRPASTDVGRPTVVAEYLKRTEDAQLQQIDLTPILTARLQQIDRPASHTPSMNENPHPAHVSAADAWDAWTRGDATTAARLISAVWETAQHRARSERQQIQVVRLAVSGAWERAGGLAAEHLSEFPGDQLVQTVQIECLNQQR